MSLSWMKINGLKQTPNCNLEDEVSRKDAKDSTGSEPVLDPALSAERPAGKCRTPSSRAEPQEAELKAAKADSKPDLSLPPYGRCHIVGSWDDFESTREMTWDAVLREYRVLFHLAEEEERFQILANGTSFERRFYPDVAGANTTTRHRVLGPDAGGHGYDWVMTRERNEGQAAPTYEIILSCPLSSSVRVSWRRREDEDKKLLADATSITHAAQAAWAAEAEEVEQAPDLEVRKSAESSSDTPLDVPPRSLAVLEVERRRQLDWVKQQLNRYEQGSTFPRLEDAEHESRDGYELFVRKQAFLAMRRRMAACLQSQAGKPKPIVLVALMPVHIATEARLEKLSDTLRSIEEQRLSVEEAELIVSISWHATSPELGERLLSILEEFRAKRALQKGGEVIQQRQFQNFIDERTGKAPVTVLTQQNKKLTQFEHIRAALASAEVELRGRSQQQAKEQSLWCLFGDDDDLWHPRRAAEFAKAIREHKHMEAVAAFVSVSRADVRKPVTVGDERMEAKLLPRTAAAVDGFMANSKWRRRRCTEDCFKEFMRERRRLQFEGQDPATLPAPLELEMEYFDMCPRLRILKEFYASTSPRILAHRFCDLRLDEFLLSYAFMGKELGLEVSWFDPGSVWMYFYSCTGIDMDGTWNNIEGEVDETGTAHDAMTFGGDNCGHVSTTFPVRKAEKVLAEELREHLQHHDEALTPTKLAKYLASFRINLEVLLVRLHTRTLDQRTFDAHIFDCAMNSFGTFIQKVQKRSHDLTSRGADKFFMMCQSFAANLAKTLDVTIFWHRPEEYLMPSLVTTDEQGLMMTRDGMYIQTEDGHFMHQEGFAVDQDGYMVAPPQELAKPTPSVQAQALLSYASNTGGGQAGTNSGLHGLLNKDPSGAGRGRGGPLGTMGASPFKPGLGTKFGGNHKIGIQAALGRGRGSLVSGAQRP